MDTVVGEGGWTDKVGWGFIALLLPFSVIAQCWQLYNAHVLWLEYSTHQNTEWHVPLTGLLFCALGLGNMVTTLNIYISKATRSSL